MAHGDTITLDAGTFAVTSTVSPVKRVTIQGSGTKGTTLTISDTTAFDIGGTSATGQIPVRITNFVLNNTTDTYAIQFHGQGSRIDNNTLDCRPSGAKCRSLYYDNFNSRHCPTWNLGSVVDSNVFYDSYPSVRGAAAVANADDFACQALSVGLGTAANVYFEDNTLTNTVFGDIIDADYGGGYVARYNTFTRNTGATGYLFDVHAFNPEDSHPRGGRVFEIYGNTITHDAGETATLRSGVGVVWGNTVINSDAATLTFLLQYPRSDGRCSATSTAYDGVELTVGADAGWPCRDQIGTGKDLTAWGGSGNYPAQEKVATYFWNNDLGDAVSVASAVAHVAIGRDYFTETSSGVRSGTAAQKDAASCTVGQAYWVTDQGYWNATNAGADGVLYRCTATDTWTLYYVPYPYPHPLRSTLAAPTGVH